MEYDYGQIIQYIDGSWDENFNEARRWCKSNKATFDELIERRKDGKRYFQINKIPEPEPARLLSRKNRLMRKNGRRNTLTSESIWTRR